MIMKRFTFIFFLLFHNNIYCQLSLSYIPAKENFIYAGVDNLVTINGLNKLDKPTVSVIWASLKKIGNEVFIINPMNVDTCIITIQNSLDTQVVFPLKVKSTPEPSLFLNAVVKKEILDQKELKEIDSLFLAIEDFDWEISYKIDSFNLTRVSSKSVTSFTNIGSKFNQEVRKLMNRASMGDMYIFDGVFYNNGNRKSKLSKNLIIRIK